MPRRPDDRASIALERRASLSRRRFLRGLGACVALPSLASLRPPRGLAAPAPLADGTLATTASGAPLRTAFIYFPNGAIPASWWPETESSGFALSRTLEPLASSREFIQVLGELDQHPADPGPDGAGDHARGGGTFLTGVRLKKSESDVRAGISIDQVFARAFGHLTRFPSLELTCEAVRKNGACDAGYSCTYQYNLSWSSPTTPMTPESNPRLVFERLFGAGAHGERQANLERRRAEQRSVLDFVLEDAHAMQRRLDTADRGKLDQYLTAVREVEHRIVQVERLGDAEDPDVETPAGVPTDYEEYIQLMFDMLILAFQSDSTRVATLMLAYEGSNRSFDHIGINEGHHDLSHHQNRADWIRKVAKIEHWYMRQFAKFLDTLRATPDSDGNPLLRNAMIVYGSGNADGNQHTHTNLPLILAGGGGGTLRPGRYTRYGSKPLTNLFLSMADRLGIADLPRFGDSTDRLGDV
jgi:hypothetical protein